MEIVLQGSISRKNKASGSSCLGFAPLHPHRLLPGILSKSILLYMLSREDRVYFTNTYIPCPPQRTLRPQKLIDPLLRKPFHPAVPPSGQKGPCTIQLQSPNLY